MRRILLIYTYLISMFILLNLVMPAEVFGVTSKNNEPVIKVGLFDNLSEIQMKIPAGGDLRDLSGRRVKVFKAGDIFSWSLKTEEPVQNNYGRLKKKDKNKKKKNVSASLLGKKMYLVSKGAVSLKGKNYPGVFLLFFKKEGVQVINLVRLEEYTKGVLRGEIGSLAPMESLKAQAVLARTYAISNLKKHSARGFDVCASEHCQVYLGLGIPRESITRAVESTRGILLGCGSEIASPMYHATCGGYTSNNEDVYGGKPVTYFRRVKCSFCSKGTNYRWVRVLPNDLLKKRLAKEKVYFNQVYRAEIESDGHLDRVKKIILTTDRGRHSIKGTTFRSAFALPSTTFIVDGVKELSLKSTKIVKKSNGKNVVQEVPVLKSSPAAKAVSVAFGMSGVMNVVVAISTFSGPPGLIIASETGLKRVRRPLNGWCMIIARSKPVSSSRALDINKNEKIILNKKEFGIGGGGSVKISGRGFGHQLGMCQAGAIEMGKKYNYRQILGYYFHGTNLKRLRY
ncbi:MAG: SpoIID/LytB domain-containing protein [Candidatus Riflebacteria bacterium]|nr:SpoIID/LytB domain-containing protein [Candidatus Riflebacteria bacterium]